MDVTLGSVQPSREMAWDASFHSASAPGPFIAANWPFILIRGIQYSARICKGATALAVAKSKDSRIFLSKPASSARLWTVSASRPSLSHTSRRKISLLFKLSSKVSLISGRRIFIGIPGKPAPDIYIKAAKNLKLEPKECIVVEDAVSGIESAKNAQIGKIIAIASMESVDLYKNIPAVSQIIKNFNEIDKNILSIPALSNK